MPQEPTRTDLSTITDPAQLNALYVQCSEALAEIKARGEIESQNLQAIRGRMSQLRAESLGNEDVVDLTAHDKDSKKD